MLKTLPTTDPHERQIASIQQNIHKSMEQLPLESLKVLQQFAAFLEQQEINGQVTVKPQQTMKLVTVSPEQVIKLSGALPTGYDGDALLDSEAYFDDI